jgi:hypothetical protein
MKRSLVLGLSAAVLSVTPAALADVTFSVTLTGSQEVPATGAAGTGSGTLTLNETTNLINGTITYSGLTGNPTGAHMHGPALCGANAGVMEALSAIPGGTAGSGTISVNVPLPTAADVQNAKDGKLYVNIHTAANTNGEIRGQLVPMGSGIVCPAASDAGADASLPDSGKPADDAGTSSSSSSSSSSSGSNGATTERADGGTSSTSGGGGGDGGCSSTGSSSEGSLAMALVLGLAVAAASRARAKR